MPHLLPQVPLGVMTPSEGAAADRLLAPPPPSHLLLGCRISSSGGEDDGTSDQASDRSEGLILIFRSLLLFFPVLRIHNMLVWIRIRIRGSMLLNSGPDPDPAIFVINLQDANIKLIKNIKKFCLLPLF
jgi:hypothetical protein